MKIEKLPRGRYVLAVSGGVDSVVLLDLLKQQPELELIVAHVDHGIRADSNRDERFVCGLAKAYHVPYQTIALGLGKHASEDQARRARYVFLRQVCKKYNAILVTAHHQDDVLETMIINLVRGTGWRGLCSLRSDETLLRPLLQISKKEILNYASSHRLEWHEDATNTDTRYLRNYVRHVLLPRLEERKPGVRADLWRLYQAQCNVRRAIDEENATLLQKQTDSTMLRYFVVMLPDPVALEYVQAFISRRCGKRLELPQARRTLLFVRTARPGSRLLPAGWVRLIASKRDVIVEPVLTC